MSVRYFEPLRAVIFIYKNLELPFQSIHKLRGKLLSTSEKIIEIMLKVSILTLSV